MFSVSDVEFKNVNFASIASGAIFISSPETVVQILNTRFTNCSAGSAQSSSVRESTCSAGGIFSDSKRNNLINVDFDQCTGTYCGASAYLCGPSTETSSIICVSDSKGKAECTSFISDVSNIRLRDGNSSSCESNPIWGSIHFGSDVREYDLKYVAFSNQRAGLGISVGQDTRISFISFVKMDLDGYLFRVSLNTLTVDNVYVSDCACGLEILVNNGKMKIENSFLGSVNINNVTIMDGVTMTEKTIIFMQKCPFALSYFQSCLKNRLVNYSHLICIINFIVFCY